jgi:prevent-host-death family protein
MDKKPDMLDVESVGDGFEAAVDRARSGDTVIVTRKGLPAAAILGIEQLEKLMSERELLRRLALGELESAGGEGEELEAVLEDCRLLLEES